MELKIAQHSKSTQTEVSPPQMTTRASVGVDATQPGMFFSMVSMLKATVYAELATHLRMPNSERAAMQIEITFKAVPYDALLAIFPEAETHHSPDGRVTTGLVRSMYSLNTQLEMESVIPHGKGCCKLVLPDSALVGRSILSFTPTWQIWSKISETGALETLLSGYLVILDESGEMRTPPNHTCATPCPLVRHALLKPSSSPQHSSVTS